MAYERLNKRSIRLFTATPEDLEKKRPNLNAPYFRVSRKDIEALLDNCKGDIFLSLGVWKRKGQDGKPDYFTAELSYPPYEKQSELLAKDDKWLAEHPRTQADADRRRKYAMNKAAAERTGLDKAEEYDIPF